MRSQRYLVTFTIHSDYHTKQKLKEKFHILPVTLIVCNALTMKFLDKQKTPNTSQDTIFIAYWAVQKACKSQQTFSYILGNNTCSVPVQWWIKSRAFLTTWVTQIIKGVPDSISDTGSYPTSLTSTENSTLLLFQPITNEWA